MDFKEKYDMYRNDNVMADDKLHIRLKDNLKESLNSLYSNSNIDENVKYLILELLEDKEHLDAFMATKI